MYDQVIGNLTLTIGSQTRNCSFNVRREPASFELPGSLGRLPDSDGGGEGMLAAISVKAKTDT